MLLTAAELSGYGAVVVEGFLMAGIEVGRSKAGELIGPGQVICMPGATEDAFVPMSTTIDALTPTTLAHLGRTSAVLGSYPELTLALSVRMLQRADDLSFMLAVSHLRRIEERVLLTLWHVASRWGRMTPHGVLIPFRITHSELARIVVAHRPPVTSAISALRAQGLLVDRPGRLYLLTGGPPGGQPSETAPMADATAVMATAETGTDLRTACAPSRSG